MGVFKLTTPNSRNTTHDFVTITASVQFEHLPYP